MSVVLDDGRSAGLNVWAFRFLERARKEDQSSGENLSERYLSDPDVLVERAERSLMEDVVKDRLEIGALKNYLEIGLPGIDVYFKLNGDLKSNAMSEILSEFKTKLIDEKGLITGATRGLKRRRQQTSWQSWLEAPEHDREFIAKCRQEIESWLVTNPCVIEY